MPRSDPSWFWSTARPCSTTTGPWTSTWANGTGSSAPTCAPVVLAREFARLLPATATGLVVNLLDQRIAAPTRGYFSYTLSKLALAAATELLAAALAPRVRVNGIAPGLTLISGPQSEADFERLIDRTPLGRGSSPDAIAQALIYLLEADVVTGQILFVDGGRRLVGRVLDDQARVGEPAPPAE